MAQAFSRPCAVFSAIQLALAQGMPLAAIPANFSYQSRGHGTGARHAQKHKHPMRNASNKYARTFNGEREMARRQRQMGMVR